MIDTGPYALVRHPMYAGAMLWMIGLPLLLDSAVGLPVGGLLIVMMGVRAVGEERLLEQALDGYADYKRRVRFRLLPGVW